MLIKIELQGRLADYNTAIRIVNGEAWKEGVENQTRELEAGNKKLHEEVEQVFIEKQRKENQLRQLMEQMDKVPVTYYYRILKCSFKLEVEKSQQVDSSCNMVSNDKELIREILPINNIPLSAI